MSWVLQFRRSMISCGMSFCDWYIEIAKVRLWKAEEDPKAANESLWTLTHSTDPGTEAASSVYAIYHRGNLLHTASGGRVHNDL